MRQLVSYYVQLKIYYKAKNFQQRQVKRLKQRQLVLLQVRHLIISVTLSLVTLKQADKRQLMQQLTH